METVLLIVQAAVALFAVYVVGEVVSNVLVTFLVGKRK